MFFMFFMVQLRFQVEKLTTPLLLASRPQRMVRTFSPDPPMPQILGLRFAPTQAVISPRRWR